MGRSAGVRPRCSLNNGKNRTGKQLDVQAKSLTNWLVPVLWACQSEKAVAAASRRIPRSTSAESSLPSPEELQCVARIRLWMRSLRGSEGRSVALSSWGITDTTEQTNIQDHPPHLMGPKVLLHDIAGALSLRCRGRLVVAKGRTNCVTYRCVIGEYLNTGRIRDISVSRLLVHRPSEFHICLGIFSAEDFAFAQREHIRTVIRGETVYRGDMNRQ